MTGGVGAQGDGTPDPQAPSAWFETRSSEVVYDRGFSRVRVDEVAMPDGSLATREVVEHGDAVAVIPVFEDGSLLLLRQYRHPFGGYQLEIPAGKLDIEGEAPEDAANRELVEETGHRAGSLEHLVTFRNSAGWCDEVTHLYLGTELAQAPAPEDFTLAAEEADMEVVRMPWEAVRDLASSGQLVDAKTLLGVLHLAAFRL